MEASDAKKLRELIRTLERRMGFLTDYGFSCCGVSFAQCHALVEIGRSGSISLNELAQILDLDNSTMSRTVNGLVTGGLAKREADPGDRRYIRIELTPAGDEQFREIERNMTRYYEQVLEKIPAEKHEQVIESLHILAEALNEHCCT